MAVSTEASFTCIRRVFSQENMRPSISAIFILINLLLCLACVSAKKNKDEDFSEFDDFDKDEFVVGR